MADTQDHQFHDPPVLKESVTEFLQKQYPKGYVVTVMRQDGTVATEKFNPHSYWAFEDLFARAESCIEFWAEYCETLPPAVEDDD